MKNVTEILANRRSYRNYIDADVADSVIEDVLQKALRTATSVNGQQISMVYIKDKAIIEKIYEINWKQKHILECSAFIVFVIDYNKAYTAMGKPGIIHDDIESLIVGSVDAGLMAQSVELLFQEQDIATCMIGGIRNDIKQVQELLNVSKYAMPILGMTVGKVEQFENEPALLRPRINSAASIFKNSYDVKLVEKYAKVYDDVLKEWWEQQGLTGHRGYCESMTQFYTQCYIKEELSQIQSAGFLAKYEEKQ